MFQAYLNDIFGNYLSTICISIFSQISTRTLLLPLVGNQNLDSCIKLKWLETTLVSSSKIRKIALNKFLSEN